MSSLNSLEAFRKLNNRFPTLENEKDEDEEEEWEDNSSAHRWVKNKTKIYPDHLFQLRINKQLNE